LFTTPISFTDNVVMANFDMILGWRDRKIYVVTPTFRRPEQVPELTRLAQTLMHVPNIVWIVVEDASSTFPHIERLLTDTGIPYYYLKGMVWVY